ncbi:CRISPR-associated endonuclease Cas3'' [Acuticoccus mangrovi]|uniref:CRISPR-associated endonuclease Cas3 n=1 Tax=Acuticoccus mangrovi TaxID=2796142 RepID=A0A934ISF6_9HYPH|nr:CRISPR-associated endonuclease Cas3'' [Acuticoccus mangrovi]MBJ3777936.1 CRISPR-associated endonuclease Cas3'' [Acuticoccus mangrovi]
MFYAHSTDRSDRTDWQTLQQHLEAVSEDAARRGEPLGIAPAARLAGLLHDLGKYTPAFQARLAGASERVDHSTAGAAVALGLAATGDDRYVAELVAHAIAGHHAGLPDRIGQGALDDRLKMFDPTSLAPMWRDEIVPEAKGLMPTLDWGVGKESFLFRFALLGRMIFSCLVDADYRDTEAFYGTVPAARREQPPLAEHLPGFLEQLKKHLAALSGEGAVNCLRGEILQHVRERAVEAPGLFTLTVPTGGGKTLASLAFALDHANRHDLRRIIVAIPFTSVVDQTAALLRGILGAETVLEHHGAIEVEGRSSDADSGADKLRLAMEDWSAPVVVTTHVQLFESLFAARPSRCRKLHNIAGSVIVLDEAQTLPRHLLAPTVRMIDALAANWRTSVVLCTATQPAFDAERLTKGHPLALPLAGRELAPDPARLAREMKRVRLHFGGAMDDTALVGALGETGQGLVIVNSRGHALALYRAAVAAGLDGMVHLTTRQYAAHRRRILKDVRDRLDVGAPCRVVATSLVEAGVDLDFPRVWRAEAGLDQIAQAAGRCNREGRRPVEESIVTVFEAPNNPAPPEIKGLVGDLARMAHKHDDLLSPDAITDYFGEVYWRLDSGIDRERICDMFRADARGTNFAYRSAAEAYRMIESGMVPVIVPRETEAVAAVADLAIADVPSGLLARRLQAHLVQVPPKARIRLLANGHVAFIAPEMRGDQFAVLRTLSFYEEDIGLVWEDADYLEAESLLV